MTPDEIEAFFLNHDDPVYEQIQDAVDEDEAEGVADDCLAESGKKRDDDYSGPDLMAVVRKIRAA